MKHGYPNDPGFQQGSATSEHAALTLSSKTSDESALYDHIELRGKAGLTIDEGAVYLGALRERNYETGQASARMRGLEAKGLISKTPLTRLTRRGKPACVYVAGSWGRL